MGTPYEKIQPTFNKIERLFHFPFLLRYFILRALHWLTMVVAEPFCCFGLCVGDRVFLV